MTWDVPAPCDLPPLPDAEWYAAALSLLVTQVNADHTGDTDRPASRAVAVVDTVRVLRADPALARLLLCD